jgi:hypothetical protein
MTILGWTRVFPVLIVAVLGIWLTGSALRSRPSRAAAREPVAGAGGARRLAVLIVARWPGESHLDLDLALIKEGLRARGVGAAEVISVREPLDRPKLLELLEGVHRRIAGWPDGELFLYYDGHGTYRPAGGAVPEPALQLNRDRDSPTSALLWRELFATLQLPPNVRMVVLADCCHTNLLAGRLPANVTALIMRSAPQSSLVCRTGSALFGAEPQRTRYSVISYYAGATLVESESAGGWLAAIDAAAQRDVAAGALEERRRVTLMVEGHPSTPVIGQPVPRAARNVR